MLSSHELAVQAERLYETQLKALLEQTAIDRFVAIEPVSGDHFLGDTLSEAAEAGRRAHPDRRAFLMRFGHRSAIHIGGAQ